MGSLPFLTREPFRVTLAYWMTSLFQCSSSMNPTMRAWKNRTSHFAGCTIMGFYQMLQRPFAVYCLISPSTRTFTVRGNLLNRKIFYVGSTLASIQSRQDARWRKLRNDLHHFCIIPVQFSDGDVDTKSFETRCIQLWKPMLNHPWIVQLNPTSITRKATPFQIQQTFTVRGSRLWKKARRRLKSLGVLQHYAFTLPVLQEARTILMTLAADAERSFHMASRLRSNEYHQVHNIFMLFTAFLFIAMIHLEVKIRSFFKKVLDFRKCPRPGAPRPLCIPMLAHSTFQKSAQTFISHLTQSKQDSLTPFHLTLLTEERAMHNPMSDTIRLATKNDRKHHQSHRHNAKPWQQRNAQ